jgi:hypothetical protein
MDDALLLKKQIEQIDTLDLMNKDIETGEFRAWHNGVLRILDRLFRTNSREYRDFDAIKFDNPAELLSGRTYRQGLRQARVTLETFVIQLDGSEPALTKSPSIPKAVDGMGSMRAKSKTVFIVHGRDKMPALELARHVEKQYNIEAIILEEQIWGGRTVIEKLEDYSKVDYAFVILTPDDEGALKGEPLKARVRQNVIFEWGEFIGKLGRSKVCLLVKGTPEIPSDLSGIGQYRFNNSIKECFMDIENELVTAKVIPPREMNKY